jgi:hypothetical protein
VGKNSKVGFA